MHAHDASPNINEAIATNSLTWPYVPATYALLLQVKYVAAPPKPKDMTSMISQGIFVDYSELCKGSYALHE